jgi:hypothetical protein
MRGETELTSYEQRSHSQAKSEIFKNKFELILEYFQLENEDS